MSASHPSYRRDIDGLRALAVALVVSFHASPAAVPGGFIGVDIFFVISGYLITTNIVRGLENKTFTYLDFYARRCRRIVPALAVVLAGTWAIGWFSLLADEFNSLGEHIVAGSAFASNLLLWKQAGYFDAAADAKPLLHLWSLGVEEQFYLLWPPLLFLLFARRLNRPSTVGILVLVSFLLNVAGIAHHSTATFYLLPTRLWELLIGAGLAHLEIYKGGFKTQTIGVLGSSAASVVSFAAILFAAFTLNAASAFPGWWAAVPAVAAFGIIAAGPDAWPNRTLLAAAPVVFVGLISYPLYLWHWPLLSVAGIIEGGLAPRSVRLGAVGVAVLLAWATWRFVEKPVQRFFVFERSWPKRRLCVALSLLCLTMIGTVGFVTRREAGFPSRFVVQGLGDLAEFNPAASDLYRKCSGTLAAGRGLSWCYTSSAGNPRLAIFGDSHAYYLFQGFADVYPASEANVLVIGETACAPLSGVRSFLKGSSEQCAAANTSALETILGSRSISTVVLTSQGPYYFSGESVAADESGLFDAANWILEPIGDATATSKTALFEQGLAKTISQIESTGKQVVFFIDVPELNFHPQSCLDTRPFRLTRDHRSSCGMPRAEVDQRQAAYRRIIRELAGLHPNMLVFDPLPYLCDDRTCSAMRGDRLLYRDSHHVSAYGSRYLAAKFRSWLQTTSLAGRA